MSDRSVKISVIIPTHNRPERLVECLEALSQQDCPSDDYEVIVVDDDSPRPLNEISSRFGDRLHLTILRQQRRGPAQARNHGAAEARGELIAFTDDDCRPATNWISALIRRFEEFPNAMIGGQVLNALVENPYSSASQALVDYLLGYFFSGNSPRRFVTSNNMALSRRTFELLGGFDREFQLAASEDRDICARLLERGLDLVLATEVIVHHYHAMDARGYWRQHAYYGQGAYHYHHLSAPIDPRSRRMEPLRFYADLLLYGFRANIPSRGFKLATLMGVSQVAHTAGYLMAASQANRRRRGDGR